MSGGTSNTAPAAPGGFTATAGNAQVLLNWTAPDNGGSAITKYQYSYGPTASYSTSWTDIPSSGPGTTSYIVTELQNGTGYTFEVRAVNAVGSGASSLTNALAVAPPPLGGTAYISGATDHIGQELTVNTGGVTGGSGAFHYQWRADTSTNIGSDQSTYTIQGADAGKGISCLVTREDATGSVTALFQGGVKVPYNITIVNVGNVAGDSEVTITSTTGRDIDSPHLYYALGDGGGMATNTLTFTGGTGLIGLTEAGENYSQDYYVNASDAVDGVITITATFLHTNLLPQTITFANGNQTKYFGSGHFTETATGASGNGAITYSSSNTGVATVNSATGEVSIVGVGQTTITAEIAADDTYLEASAGYVLTVNPVALTKVTKVTITNSASTYTYKAADAVHTMQHAVNILPANAKVKTVSWKSSNNQIATVNAAGLVTFTGKEGTVRITATSPDGPAHYKDIKVVKNVTKLRTPLTARNLTVKKKISVKPMIDDGSTVITAVLTYKSSNPKIATVDANGNVKGIKKGKVTITIQSQNGKKATVKINVAKKAVKLKKFTLTGIRKNALTLQKGKTKDLKIKLAQSKASDLKVTFKSSKSSVAKVDAAGRITAVKKGTATITAKVGSKTVKVKVTVK